MIIFLAIAIVGIILFGIFFGEQKNLLSIALTMFVFAIGVGLVVFVALPYARSSYEEATANAGLITDTVTTSIISEDTVSETTSVTEVPDVTTVDIEESSQTTTAAPIIIVDGKTYILSETAS